MSKKQVVLIPYALRAIDFFGDTLAIALVGDEAYIALRPIAEFLGLEWSSQYRRTLRDNILLQHMSPILMTSADRRQREMVCLQLEYLPGWLFGITPSRVKSEHISKLRRYREECFHVLWCAFQADLGNRVQPSHSDESQELYFTHQQMIGNVQAQCTRARSMNLPATLTVEQWLLTVEHFGRRCAYCQMKPGVIIEHFIPVSQGGATTIGNCVPSCYACNGKKSGNHPDAVTTIPREVLNSVRDQLASRVHLL